MVVPEKGVVFPLGDDVVDPFHGQMSAVPKVEAPPAFTLLPEVVDPLGGKMEATPQQVPCVDAGESDCDDLLGVVEGTRVMDLGC